jgi:hypothetical protein
MTTLTVDNFTSAASFSFLSTGSTITKKTFLDVMVCSVNVEKKYASKIWQLMEQTGRIKKNVVCDITEAWNVDTKEVIKTVLKSLKADDSSYLSDPVMQALHTVTGLSYATIQAALNALEQEYFLEQRRAVNPAQIIVRNWA